MWLKQLRARRIAAVRRQLTALDGGPTGPLEPTPDLHLECGGREHLISAGTWLVAAHYRALRKERDSPAE